MYRTEQEIGESPAVAAPPQRRRRAWWESSARPRSQRRQPTWWSRLPTVLRRAIVFVVLIAFWQAYVSLKHVSPLVFSSPAAAIKALVSGWSNGQIAAATATTLEVLLIGMAIGLVIGVLFTVFATATTLGRDFVMLMTAMVNPLPSIAILPLAIIWFGINKADSTGRRNTSITGVCDGAGEADAAGACGCPAAVGGGSGVAAADAVTGPA